MAYIEMRWRCPYCGNENLGRNRNCSGCEHPRDDSVKFYMPGKGNFTRVEHIETTQPDWVCGYCNALNKAVNSKCIGCGANRTADSADYFTNKPGYSGIFDLDGNLKENSTNAASGDYKRQPAVALPRRQSSQFNKSAFFGFLAVLVFFALIALGVNLYQGYQSAPKKCRVTAIEWNADYGVEAYRTVVEQNWSVPTNGRYISEAEALHHIDKVFDHYETVVDHKSRQVLDHYETITETKTREVFSHYETVVVGHRDLGNGFAEEITESRPVYRTEFYTESYEQPVYRTEFYTEEREVAVYNDVPVYAVLYTYEIERWVYARTEHLSSNDHNKGSVDALLGDNERLSSVEEKYFFTVELKNGSRLNFATDESNWKKLNTGKTIKIDIRFYEVDSIEFIE